MQLLNGIVPPQNHLDHVHGDVSCELKAYGSCVLTYSEVDDLKGCKVGKERMVPP